MSGRCNIRACPTASPARVRGECGHGEEVGRFRRLSLLNGRTKRGLEKPSVKEETHWVLLPSCHRIHMWVNEMGITKETKRKKFTDRIFNSLALVGSTNSIGQIGGLQA